MSRQRRRSTIPADYGQPTGPDRAPVRASGPTRRTVWGAYGTASAWPALEECRACGRRFTSAEKLSAHVAEHTIPLPDKAWGRWASGAAHIGPKPRGFVADRGAPRVSADLRPGHPGRAIEPWEWGRLVGMRRTRLLHF